jgi:hypothetical protein
VSDCFLDSLVDCHDYSTLARIIAELAPSLVHLSPLHFTLTSKLPHLQTHIEIALRTLSACGSCYNI